VQQELEARVRERTSELRLILEGSNDGVWVWYLDDERIVYSRRWLEMIDASEQAPSSPDFWFARDEQGRVELLAGTQSDITALRCVDTHSGLPNERSFRENIEDILSEGADSSVALISFNRLGDLVEPLDNQTIEQLRTETRLRLLERLPSRCFLAHLPGNQFGVLFRQGSTDPQSVLESLCRAFDAPAELGGTTFHWLGLSVGAIDLKANPVSSVDDCLAKCWLAVRASRSSKDRALSWFEPEMRLDAARVMAMENTVRRAVADERVLAFFQPIVATSSGCRRNA